MVTVCSKYWNPPGVVPVAGEADADTIVKALRNDAGAPSSGEKAVIARRDGKYFTAAFSKVDNTASAKEIPYTVYAIRDDASDNKQYIQKKSGSYTVPKREQTPTYDPDGNMLTNGDWAYTWNGENRLIVAESTDKRLEFTYDYMGRRVSKQVYTGSVGNWTLASESKYAYDGWNCIAIFNTSDVLQKSYLWGEDLSGSLQGAGGVGGLLAVTDTTATYFPMYDGNGNIMTYVDTVGTVQADYTYDPFGRTLSQSGTLAEDFLYRFSTKPLDIETGLYYYGYRYYSSDLGRWLSRDPIEEAGGMNIYGMVGNDPISYFDVLGFKPWFSMRIDEYDGLTLSGSIPDLLSDFIFQPVNTTSNKYNEALDWFERQPYKDLISEIEGNSEFGRPCSKVSKSSSSIGPSPGNTFFKFKRPTGYKIPEKLGNLLLNAANAFTGGATYQNSTGANLEESNIDYTKKFDYLKNNYINFPKRHKLPYVDNNLYPAGRVSNGAQLTTSGMLYLLDSRTYPEINVRIDCSNQCYDITFKQFGRNTRLDGASDRIPLSFLRSWYSFYNLRCPLREGL
jgi:RHS repeat-associated protein